MSRIVKPLRVSACHEIILRIILQLLYQQLKLCFYARLFFEWTDLEPYFFQEVSGTQTHLKTALGCSIIT